MKENGKELSPLLAILTSTITSDLMFFNALFMFET